MRPLNFLLAKTLACPALVTLSKIAVGIITGMTTFSFIGEALAQDAVPKGFFYILPAKVSIEGANQVVTSDLDEPVSKPDSKKPTAENEEWIEVIPRSPPLKNIDDAGVPDFKQLEVSLSQPLELIEKGGLIAQQFLDLNYGTRLRWRGKTIGGEKLNLDRIQLKYEGGFTQGRAERGVPNTYGVTTMGVGTKINFYNDEKHGIALAFYPQYFFSPQNKTIQKGLAEEGVTVTLPFIATKSFLIKGQRRIGINGNYSINRGTRGAPNSKSTSFGLGWTPTKRIALMGSISDRRIENAAKNKDDNWNVGVQFQKSNRIKPFAMVGHTFRSELSPDGKKHWFMSAGLQIVIGGAR